MRFRNTNPYPLTVRDPGLTVGPFGEFDFPGYDPAVHGVIPGCEPVDAPAAAPDAATPPPIAPATPKTNPAPATAPQAATSPAPAASAAASEENKS